MNLSLPFFTPFVRYAEVFAWTARDPAPAPRRLYDHELLYITSGQIKISIADKTATAHADQLLFFPPRVLQKLLSPEVPHTQIGVHFDWAPREDTTRFTTFRPAVEPFEESLFRETQFIPNWDWEISPLLDLRGRPRVRQLLNEVVAAHHAGSEYLRWQAGVLLMLAIAQIAHEACLLRDVSANPHIGADAIRRVHRARELLEDASTPLPSIPEIARKIGWSADHLGRMCREVLGVSPYQLQMQARLRRAQEMLRYGNIGVAEIALRCGFHDTSHFASAFKQETGFTPRQFSRMKMDALSSAETV